MKGGHVCHPHEAGVQTQSQRLAKASPVQIGPLAMLAQKWPAERS
jgi:hypothetical protein